MSGPENGGKARYIPIGAVDRARGLAGEVVVTVFADDPSRMARLDALFLEERDGSLREVAVEGYKRLGGRAVLKLAGIGSVEEARALVGRTLFLPPEASTPAPEGRYYAYQLVGLEARRMDGTPLGTVHEVLRQGPQTLLVVRDGPDEFLVPMVRAICVEFDLAARTLTLDPPDGLIELNRKGSLKA